MTGSFDPKIRWIPISQINVVNPRQRGKFRFAKIVANIGRLGLKRPITVAEAKEKDGEPRFDLVCGQGRLEAYIELGQIEIPAIVVEGTREDLLLMGLAENLARRGHRAVELVQAISRLKESGYTNTQIAKKTDLALSYVGGILQLLTKGEERLLQAVEKGHLPVSIAISIATSDEKSVQTALQEAYERNDLRGKALLRARRLIETRRAKGKLQHGGPRLPKANPASADSLLKAFQEETMKQKMVVQKAKICETRLLFSVSALRQLFQDDHFVTLLRAEGLDSLPQYLAQQMSQEEVVK